MGKKKLSGISPGKVFVPPDPPWLFVFGTSGAVTEVLSVQVALKFLTQSLLSLVNRFNERGALGPSPGQGTSMPHFKEKERARV